MTFGLVCGCATTKEGWTSYPRADVIKNGYYVAQLQPARMYDDDDSYYGFFLYIKNISREVIHIDWNRTYYIEEFKKRGTFIVGGDHPQLPYFPLEPEKIQPGQIFQDNLWPKFLTRTGSDDSTPRKHLPFAPGTHGVYLTVTVHGFGTSTMLAHPSHERQVPWLGSNQARQTTGNFYEKWDVTANLKLSIVKEIAE